MLRLIVILQLALLIGSASAQTITFHKTYGGAYEDKCFDSQQTSDGGYILAGYTETSIQGTRDMFIVKTNEHGDTLWTRSFGGVYNDEARSIEQTTDGGYIIGGYTQPSLNSDFDMLMIKLNSVGDTMWTRRISTPNDDVIFDIHEANNGGYVMTGVYSDTVTLIKTDGLGNITWRKGQHDLLPFNTSRGCFPALSGISCWSVGLKVKETTSGNLILIILEDPLPNIDVLSNGNLAMPSLAFVVYTDSSGNSVWIYYPWSTPANIEDVNGGIIIGDHGLNSMIYLDSNLNGNVTVGDTLWTDSLLSTTTAWSILNDKGFVIVSNNVPNSFVPKTLTKKDSAGNNIWIRSLDSNVVYNSNLVTGAVYSNVFACTDNGIAISGWGYNRGIVNSGADFQLIKTDSLGMFDFSCSNLGITTNGGIDDTICLNDSLVLDAGVGYDRLEWYYSGSNNDDTTRFITVTQPGTYQVVYHLREGLLTECWERDTFDVSVTYPFDQEICIVTVDTTTGKNLIVWEKQQTGGIVSYNIYKQNSQTSNYDLIATQPVAALSTYLDTTSNPTQISDRYKITVLDTCGNESDLSPEHRTIHVSSNRGVNSEVNLSWNPYEGYTYTNFNIYRGSNPSNLTLIGTAPNNTYSYTDQNPPSGTLYYMVEVLNPNGCTPTAKRTTYSGSRSNIVDNGISGVPTNDADTRIMVYPNPFTDQITLKLPITVHGTYGVTMYDVTGRAVFSNNGASGETFQIDGLRLSKGLYYIQLVTEFENYTVQVICD